jgi:hypothetical protein
VKGIICTFVLLLFVSVRLHAQWTQLQDTSLLTYRINDVAQIGNTLYVASASGVYYSNTDSIAWKRTGGFYMQPKCICAIDSDIFILVETSSTDEIFRSADRGKSWNPLSSGPPTAKPGNLYLYALNHTLFLTSGYDAIYSVDKGNKWTYTTMVYGDTTPYYVGSHFALFRRADGPDNSYYISTDGLHLKPFTKVKYTTLPTRQTWYDAGKVYLMQDSFIKVYDTLSGLVTTYGSSPGLEAKLMSDTFYSVDLFFKCGNTFYINYLENTLHNNMSAYYRNIVYSSNDGCKHWKKEDNFPLSAFWGSLYSFGSTVLTDYGQYLFHEGNNTVSAVPPGIQSQAIIASMADSAVLYEAGGQLVRISPGNKLSKKAQQPEDFRLVYRIYPLDQEDNAVKHNRFIDNNSIISEDYGNTWSPLLLPSVKGNRLTLLGYTSNDLLENNKDSVYYSEDGGQNWHSVPATAGYIGFQNAHAAKSGNKFAVIVSDTARQDYYQAFLSEDGMNSLHPYGGPLHAASGYIQANTFIGANGTLVAIFVEYYTGVKYKIYTLDTATRQWHTCMMAGLPKSLQPVLLTTQGILFYYNTGDGLYISKDFGDTFTKDNTFPTTLNLQYFSISNTTPHLGNTIYLNTNAGIWYNTSILGLPQQAEAPANNFTVYPNPARDNLYISLSSREAGQGSVSIIDMHGHVCQQNTTSISKGTNTINISTTNLRNGMYILQLKTREQVYTRKVVVK